MFTHRPQYIGVTGFMSKSEVATAIAALEGLPNWSGRHLMVGVLASQKTLSGMGNKYPNRYPHVSTIANLFPAHRRTVNLIHYATDDTHTLPEQLDELKKIGGRSLDGFQLNVTWPEPVTCDMGKEMRIVLQINKNALEQVNHDPVKLAEMIGYYKSFITDVLIDGSGGRGLPLDVNKTLEYVTAISAAHRSWLGIGFAGGLSNEGMSRLSPIADRFPNVSVDAEGRLRTPDDHMNTKAMQEYISIADGLFDG